MTDPTEIARVAAGLTEARKAMILALPADGSWGRVPSRSVAKRAWWGMIPGIIEHRHCPPSPDEEWGLSKLGIVLHHILREKSGEA